MTKREAEIIEVGTKLRAGCLGIDRVWRVEDIRRSGPRNPYFRLGKVWVTYRDCAHASHRMTTSRYGSPLSEEERAARKRERDRRYSKNKRRKEASCG